MRLFRYSLAALGLSTLLLGVVVAHAVLAPLPEKAPEAGTWSTVVIKY
jgi:hypothetical protein